PYTTLFRSHIQLVNYAALDALGLASFSEITRNLPQIPRFSGLNEPSPTKFPAVSKNSSSTSFVTVSSKTTKHTSPSHSSITGKHLVTRFAPPGNPSEGTKRHSPLTSCFFIGSTSALSTMTPDWTCLVYVALRLPGIFLPWYLAAESTAFLKAKSGIITLPLALL